MKWHIKFLKMLKTGMFLIKKPQNEAFKLAKSSNHSEAGLVGGVMLAKRKLSLGL